MKKFFMLIAGVLGLQVFAAADPVAEPPMVAPLPLTARFIADADLTDDSPIHERMRSFVSADTAEKWLSAKGTMEQQIAAGVIRRVLFFRGEELVTSCRAGKMPVAVTPVTRTDDGFGFTNGQESIANVYRFLTADITQIEAYAEGTFTWSIQDGDAQEILAATLMLNEIQDSALVSAMHKAAYSLFEGVPLNGALDRLPSLYISLVFPMEGIEEADFGLDLSLQRGALVNEEDTLLHNYYPANADGMRYILAGNIN